MVILWPSYEKKEKTPRIFHSNYPKKQFLSYAHKYLFLGFPPQNMDLEIRDQHFS